MLKKNITFVTLLSLICGVFQCDATSLDGAKESSANLFKIEAKKNYTKLTQQQRDLIFEASVKYSMRSMTEFEKMQSSFDGLTSTSVGAFVQDALAVFFINLTTSYTGLKSALMKSTLALIADRCTVAGICIDEGIEHFNLAIEYQVKSEILEECLWLNCLPEDWPNGYDLSIDHGKMGRKRGHLELDRSCDVDFSYAKYKDFADDSELIPLTRKRLRYLIGGVVNIAWKAVKISKNATDLIDKENDDIYHVFTAYNLEKFKDPDLTMADRLDLIYACFIALNKIPKDGVKKDLYRMLDEIKNFHEFIETMEVWIWMDKAPDGNFWISEIKYLSDPNNI